MKEIPLSQQKRRNSKNLGLVALVDDEDYEWLSQSPRESAACNGATKPTESQ